MSTQRGFPWFWKQRSLLFWNGWLQGGAIVVVLLIVPLGAVVRPLIWPGVYAISVAIVLIPHLIGMRRFIADARVQVDEQMRRQEELLLEMSQMSAAIRKAREDFEEIDRDRHRG